MKLKEKLDISSIDFYPNELIMTGNCGENGI